jgi:magnesium transporter
MLLELRFSVWTLGLTSGTFIAALYGMNLKNWIEEHDIGFGGVSAVCFAVSAVVLVYGLNRLRSVQRVSMWGRTSARSSLGRSQLHDMFGEEHRGLPLGYGLKGHLQGVKEMRMGQEKMLREQREQLERAKRTVERPSPRVDAVEKTMVEKARKPETGTGPLWDQAKRLDRK